MKIGISFKILAVVVTSILGLGIFLSAYFISHERATYLAEFDLRAQVLVDSLAAASEYPVLTGNKEAMAKAGEAILAQKDAVYCRIEAEKGAVLFEGGSRKDLARKEYFALIKTVKLSGSEEDMLLGQQAKTVENIGRVMIDMSLSDVNHKIADMRRTIMFFVLLGVFAAALVITALVYVLLNRPIHELIVATEHVAEGDLAHQVKVRYDDELGKLARAFNDMTSDLKKVTVSRDYVDGIIENMTDALIVTDLRANILTINKATADLLGLPHDQIIGQPVSKFVATPELFGFEGFSEKGVDGRIKNVETEYILPDAQRVTVLFSGALLTDAKGGITGIMGVAKDITERKNFENELKQMLDESKRMHQELVSTKDKLVQSEKMASLGQLAAGVAHEINNPLGFIMSNVQMLKNYIARYQSVIIGADRLKVAVGQSATQELA
ncbi:MAG: PAS domain S-box protein, partial [Candidatus Omnitrophica bacterium]|nr:PAS domain S-box protein [Candidatus Omnitrophota bacterium]